MSCLKIYMYIYIYIYHISTRPDAGTINLLITYCCSSTSSPQGLLLVSLRLSGSIKLWRIRDHPRLFPQAPSPWIPYSEIVRVLRKKIRKSKSFGNVRGKPPLGHSRCADSNFSIPLTAESTWGVRVHRVCIDYIVRGIFWQGPCVRGINCCPGPGIGFLGVPGRGIKYVLGPSDYPAGGHHSDGRYVPWKFKRFACCNWIAWGYRPAWHPTNIVDCFTHQRVHHWISNNNPYWSVRGQSFPSGAVPKRWSLPTVIFLMVDPLVRCL